MGKMKSRGKSSSSKNISQKEAISEQVKEKEPENKKLKQNVAANSQNETTQKSINDLPTEMLMKILKYVDDVTLVAFRLVNRKLRDISTKILCTRGEIELQFTFDETNKIFKQWINNKMGKRSLGDFLQCFKESKNCFYTRFLFRFNLVPLPSKFENEDLIKFLSYIKNYIKCLKLLVEPTFDSSIQSLSEDLSDLLLNKLPQLEEFGVNLSSNQLHIKLVHLFPSQKVSKSTITTRETATAKTTITTTTIEILPAVQLPHLKVLHLSEVLISKCPIIVHDLLKAAVNLKEIRDEHIHRKDCFKNEDYVFLHSSGKLDLLEEAEMTPSVELFSALEGNTQGFKLGYLKLHMSSIYNDNNKWTNASTFLSGLFESSKDTLTELRMDPIGFLPDIKFPEFTKLEMLTVLATNESDIYEPVFPSGIHYLDIFPVLRIFELNVDWTKCFPGAEHIPRIPTVECLRVSDWKITGNCILKMSLMCPNMKDFTVLSVYDEKYNANFLEIGRAIWTHMKQLQSLDLQIDLMSNFNTFHALDSCFTGISVENCSRLYELKKAEEYLKRWNSQLNIPKEEFETPERESVSILDLKDLTTLRVQVDWDVGDRTTVDNLFERALTCVSEAYAFKLMKNLNYNIHQNVDF